MKKTALLIFSLATVLGAFSQSTCPVQPQMVKNVNSQIVVDFQNNSGKHLSNYHFGLSFVDLNGHSHSFPLPLTGNIPLRAQRHRTAIWQNRLTLRFMFPLATAYVKQATFSDGSVWLDDGSRSCSVTSVQE
jgi:hypothetical protein